MGNFMNNSGFNNNANTGNNGEAKVKRNFNIGKKLDGDEGALRVTIWNSDRGMTFTSIRITQLVGRDPTTNAPIYEQKMPNDLPSVLMNDRHVYCMLEAMKASEASTANFTIECGKGATISIQGQGTSFKVTIHNDKGDRTATFKAIQVGSTAMFPEWKFIMDRLTICQKYMMTKNIDKDEFGAAITPATTTDEESPF
jgi:hypothetical protein